MIQAVVFLIGSFTCGFGAGWACKALYQLWMVS